MNIEIITPKNLLLRNFVQYFLFFRKQSEGDVSYTTFPNNNLCLAVYKNNKVEYKNSDNSNICNISHGNKAFASRLYGFHKNPFQVNVESSLDQISILFQPAALRYFTKESFKDLMSADDIFSNIFRLKQHDFLEKLFEENNSERRAETLENFLLKNLNNENTYSKIRKLIYLISTTDLEELSVERITRKLGINESTLYRVFSDNIGQSPKSYLKTIRFRKALSQMVKGKRMNLSDVAYSHNFFDQSHFIKEFKAFTGYTPKKLNTVTSVAQKELVWIYKKN